MFDLLENAGASCLSVVTDAKNTLLHWFCCNIENDEHTSILKKLISKGCDIDAENRIQRTPLMLVAKSNMINTCHILLDAQAKTDKMDFKGYRAVDLAKPNSECFKLLQQVINIQQRQNITHTISNDIVLRRKLISTTRRVTAQISEPISHSNNNEVKIKRNSSTGTHEGKIFQSQMDLSYTQSHEIEEAQESDAIYKRVWEKLIQTGQRKRRTIYSSLQRVNYVS
jgi:hypothetical protein